MPYADHRAAAASIVVRCAIVTISDTRNESTDHSGRAAKNLIESAGHQVSDYRIVPDEPAKIEAALEHLLTAENVDAILTTGGTGVSRRDQTIPLIERLLDIPLPGFGELFRMLSWQQIGSGAMLSRAIGGVAHGKLLFAMPGSTAAVELALSKLILPEIQHLLHELRK